MGKYRKVIAATVGAMITWGTAVVISEPAPVTASEWLQLAGGLATAWGVYQISNNAS